MLDTANLPVGSPAVLAEREGRRPVPIYQTHRSFARHLSSAFRAILTAAKIEHDADFWEGLYRGVDFTGETVLDPFVGGGTSVVEDARRARTCGTCSAPPRRIKSGLGGRVVA